jgi:hypothetical protein
MMISSYRIVFAIGFSVIAIVGVAQEGWAATANPFTSTCMDKDGHWFKEGTSCGPRTLDYTCQRVGNGPALTCLPRPASR